MANQVSPTTLLRHLLCLALVGSLLFVSAVAQAADDAIERERLAALLRQVELTDYLAEQTFASLPPHRARYYFDYARLREDMQRVKAGIQDYLIPQRAQPRDASLLVGEYRSETLIQQASP